MSCIPCIHNPAAPLPLKSCSLPRSRMTPQSAWEGFGTQQVPSTGADAVAELCLVPTPSVPWHLLSGCSFLRGSWPWHPVMSAASWTCSRNIPASFSSLGQIPTPSHCLGAALLFLQQNSTAWCCLFQESFHQDPSGEVGGSLGAHQKYAAFFCPQKR